MLAETIMVASVLFFMGAIGLPELLYEASTLLLFACLIALIILNLDSKEI